MTCGTDQEFTRREILLCPQPSVVLRAAGRRSRSLRHCLPSPPEWPPRASLPSGPNTLYRAHHDSKTRDLRHRQIPDQAQHQRRGRQEGLPRVADRQPGQRGNPAGQDRAGRRAEGA